MRTRVGIGKKANSLILSLLFALPSFALFSLFVLIPIARTVHISFFSWDGIQPTMTAAGLRNYPEVLGEEEFRQAVVNTISWAFMHVVFACFTGLLAAYVVYHAGKARNLFRSILFLPNILALPVAALIWSMMYNPNFGVINAGLTAAGLGQFARPWLGDPKLALAAAALASAWQAYGYYMILFLAGLQSIDPSLYEAARLDGAGWLRRLVFITIPSLRNIMTFVLNVSIINGLMGFATVWTMTQGGPRYSTYLIPLYIYRKAFLEYDFGRAAAGSVILGLAVLTLTVVYNRMREKEG